MSEAVTLEFPEERLGVITMNRPDRLNVVNTEWLDAWTDVVDRLDGEDVSAAVVRSTARVFSAGGDLKGRIWELPIEERRVDVKKAYDLTQRMRESPVVFIAAVNGGAVGAGTSLALACDFRIADTEARFSLEFVKLGLLPDMGGAYLLPQVIALPNALEMAILGEPVYADQALEWGLVRKVVASEDLFEEAMTFARKVAVLPPLAVRAVKRAVYNLHRAPLAEGYEQEMEELLRLMQTSDNAEAVQAWVDKRPPRFIGM